jgi:hypothetical protein
MSKKNIAKGWIYCLSNKSMIPELYKIGYTNFLEKRVFELQKGSGVPCAFHIEFAKNVTNPFEKEQKIHEILNNYRFTKNREFFKTKIINIKKLFELVDGEWYDEDIEKTLGKYVCKYFNNKPYYGIVFNVTIVKNNQTKNYEKVSCIIYEDNDREDLNLKEFNEFQCNREQVPSEILNKLLKHNIYGKKNKNI